LRPYHFCGVESPISILCAGLLNVPTGAYDYEQRYDIIAYANAPIRAGHKFVCRKDDARGYFDFRIRPALPVKEENPIPFYLAEGLTLSKDLAVGELLTPQYFEVPASSMIWNLRKEQDLYTFA